MCDQLRADHLSCYGSRQPGREGWPIVDTPHIDALAARGLRFERAFVQSGVCGPSRMSYYTGRYASTHGSSWNFVPLALTERTLGDHLRDGKGAVKEAHLIGKTHVTADAAGMRARGIDPASPEGVFAAEGGFQRSARHEDTPALRHDYNAWLRAHGYDGADPWTDHAASGVDESGQVVTGSLMRNAHLAARVQDAHSETAYVSDLAIDFIRDKGDTPWVLHLSYIKPHWPYIVSAPYHDLYRGHDLYRNAELEPLLPHGKHPHPVEAAYRRVDEGQSFGRAEVARHVRPAYMGLVKQIDDHLGRVLAALREAGREQDTLVILTSDHGDFLGDRGFGDKELFYDEIQNVPLIIADPRASADVTRGRSTAELVQAIDLLPTMLEALDVARPEPWLEGKSLLPVIDGTGAGHDCVFSELDYAMRETRRFLGRGTFDNCRGFMARTADWKYVHWDGYPAQLFDLRADPLEHVDLGASPAHAAQRAQMRERLFDWLGRLKRRPTVDGPFIDKLSLGPPPGIFIGKW